jgi:predicted metalloendopeptidase
VIRPEAAAARQRTDPHAPDKLRVNVPLTQLPELAAAFACPQGAPMRSAQPCEIW